MSKGTSKSQARPVNRILLRYTKSLARARRLKELQTSLGLEGDKLGFEALRTLAAFDDPTTLHELMFVPNIEALCTPEQQAVWLPRCDDWRVLGCYAQTEIGHGSNVRALETTATFDVATDEFVLETPTLTSTKFWPGSMGKTANHAMVIARLRTPDASSSSGGFTDRGVHNFIVPLRDENHALMPGVATGDLGPKLGFNNMDNGFLQLSGVRVPRAHMAARMAHVTKDGAYVATADPTAVKLAGLTMTAVRASIIQGAGRALAQACTIAVRYSAVRKQGYTDAGNGDEHRVLEYPTQRTRLLPLLAASYCFWAAGLAVAKLMADTEALAKAGLRVPPAMLAELHATSSGLKAHCTGVAGDGIETCRRACGGHGYLQASGLPPLLGTYLQTVKTTASQKGEENIQR